MWLYEGQDYQGPEGKLERSNESKQNLIGRSIGHRLKN